jgi:hypothetical protein
MNKFNYMNQYLLAVILGIIAWFIGFMAGIPLTAASQYMHTAQTVLGVFLGMIFAAWYFLRLSGPYLRQGLVLGVIWLVLMIVLDLAFLLPFIQGGVAGWFASIGLGYFSIPVMTTIFGWALDKKSG